MSTPSFPEINNFFGFKDALNYDYARNVYVKINDIKLVPYCIAYTGDVMVVSKAVVNFFEYKITFFNVEISVKKPSAEELQVEIYIGVLSLASSTLRITLDRDLLDVFASLDIPLLSSFYTLYTNGVYKHDIHDSLALDINDYNIHALDRVTKDVELYYGNIQSTFSTDVISLNITDLAHDVVIMTRYSFEYFNSFYRVSAALSLDKLSTKLVSIACNLDGNHDMMSWISTVNIHEYSNYLKFQGILTVLNPLNNSMSLSLPEYNYVSSHVESRGKSLLQITGNSVDFQILDFHSNNIFQFHLTAPVISAVTSIWYHRYSRSDISLIQMLFNTTYFDELDYYFYTNIKSISGVNIALSASVGIDSASLILRDESTDFSVGVCTLFSLLE